MTSQKSSDIYVPPKSNVYRPGAMEAFKLPSYSNGVRTPYRPPIHGCVGAKKPLPVDFEK